MQMSVEQKKNIITPPSMPADVSKVHNFSTKTTKVSWTTVLSSIAHARKREDEIEWSLIRKIWLYLTNFVMDQILVQPKILLNKPVITHWIHPKLINFSCDLFYFFFFFKIAKWKTSGYFDHHSSFSDWTLAWTNPQVRPLKKCYFGAQLKYTILLINTGIFSVLKSQKNFLF